MISKYNDFIIENEFNKILDDIFKIVESEGRWTGPNTIEWDMSPEEPEENPDLIDKSLEKIKNLITGLSKEKVKQYFIRLLNKLKPLPEKIRKYLIVHYTSVFLTVASLGFLIGYEDTTSTNTNDLETEQLDPKIKEEVINLTAKSSFEEAQSAVKEVEAGYSDDKNDTGNWVEVPGFGMRFIGTNHGISAPILQKYLGRIPKKEDMENLSYKTALEIYKQDYWNAQNLSYLCDQSVANIIYDGCVNQGVDGMSQVIRDAAREQSTNLNGNVYSKSNIRRLNSLDQQELFNSIKKFREERYREAATWNIHGEGWMNRLASIEYQNSDK